MSKISEDSTLRALVQAARAWGVSPSVMMGRKPVTITHYSYDESGVLRASQATTEPEWTRDDLQLAVDLLAWESSLCSGCGHSLAETTDPKNQYAYEAGPAVRCHRCTASSIAMERYQKESPQPDALMIPINLVRPDDLRGSDE